MGNFVLIVEFLVKKECLGDFTRLIEINSKASVNNEPGCFQFDVNVASDDPTKVLLYEVYESEAAFQVHMRQGHTQTFLTAAKPLITSQSATRWTRQVAPKVKQ